MMRMSRSPYSASGRPPLTKGRQGFTMIEIIAVVAIFAMVFSLGLPRLSISKKRRLEKEAETLTASFEYARQRAIMSGVPHRVFIDLENGAYRTEWWVTEEEAIAALEGSSGELAASEQLRGIGDSDAANPYDSGSPLDRHPPRRAERDYSPVPNRQLGAFTWLNDATFFGGLEGSSGWIESGEVQIVFDADGTTDLALLEFADADDNYLTLEIEPILDRVRIREGKARR